MIVLHPKNSYHTCGAIMRVKDEPIEQGGNVYVVDHSYMTIMRSHNSHIWVKKFNNIGILAWRYTSKLGEVKREYKTLKFCKR